MRFPPGCVLRNKTPAPIREELRDAREGGSRASREIIANGKHIKVTPVRSRKNVCQERELRAHGDDGRCGLLYSQNLLMATIKTFDFFAHLL
jgi:hypothetical protein